MAQIRQLHLKVYRPLGATVSFSRVTFFTHFECAPDSAHHMARCQPFFVPFMLQQLRRQQTSPELKARYERRAVEGTISQGTRGFGLRRSRYMARSKRISNTFWPPVLSTCFALLPGQAGIPQAKTRISRFAVLQASYIG